MFLQLLIGSKDLLATATSFTSDVNQLIFRVIFNCQNVVQLGIFQLFCHLSLYSSFLSLDILLWWFLLLFRIPVSFAKLQMLLQTVLYIKQNVANLAVINFIGLKALGVI